MEETRYYIVSNGSRIDCTSEDEQFQKATEICLGGDTAELHEAFTWFTPEGDERHEDFATIWPALNRPELVHWLGEDMVEFLPEAGWQVDDVLLKAQQGDPWCIGAILSAETPMDLQRADIEATLPDTYKLLSDYFKTHPNGI